jgi:hypothetical protein
MAAIKQKCRPHSGGPVDERAVLLSIGSTALGPRSSTGPDLGLLVAVGVSIDGPGIRRMTRHGHCRSTVRCGGHDRFHRHQRRANGQAASADVPRAAAAAPTSDVVVPQPTSPAKTGPRRRRGNFAALAFLLSGFAFATLCNAARDLTIGGSSIQELAVVIDVIVFAAAVGLREPRLAVDPACRRTDFPAAPQRVIRSQRRDLWRDPGHHVTASPFVGRSASIGCRKALHLGIGAVRQIPATLWTVNAAAFSCSALNIVVLRYVPDRAA